MKILKRGKKLDYYYTMKCPYCGCKFQFENENLNGRIYELGTHLYRPQCKRKWYLSDVVFRKHRKKDK